MADIDPNELNGPEQADQAPISGRGPSVRLRDPAGAGTQGPRMDPANQSLADALRFTYGLLRVVMIVLVALFFVSGVKTINEGERGIRVMFGRPVSDNLEPGLHLNAPYPVGEMVRVESGTVEVKLGRAFMPYSSRARTDTEAMTLPAENFSSDSKLKPGRAGSNITADLNIAHTQWTINYRRVDHEEWAENVAPGYEESMVRAAIQRGVVHALAGVTIDNLLKDSGDSVAATVKKKAQDSLDRMKTGIVIDRVALSRKIPPVRLLDRFSSVQAAAQNASKQREDALLIHDQMMNRAAGPAAPLLIKLINEYERLIELNEAEEAEALLADIDALLEGRPVEIDGQIQAAGLVSGEVARVINDARGQVSTMISQSIADRDYFLAKQAQLESNPRLMISRDWSDAMTQFMAKDFVQAMILPEGVDLAELLISEDPEIRRELDRERKRAEAEEALERRIELQRQDSFRSRRGIQEEGE